MRRTLGFVAALALVACESATSISPPSSPPDAARLPNAEHGGYGISVTMTGLAERPGPGDPDGSGEATLNLMPRQERICYTINVSRIKPAPRARTVR